MKLFLFISGTSTIVSSLYLLKVASRGGKGHELGFLFGMIMLAAGVGILCTWAYFVLTDVEVVK